MTRWRQRGWVLLLVAMLAGCGPREKKAPASAPPRVPPAPTTTNAATHLDAPAHPPVIETPKLSESIATIQGADEEAVKSPRNGYLVRQVYKDGAMVAAGDVLFLLDPRVTHDGINADNASLVKVFSPRAGVPLPAKHGPGDWIEAGTELTSVARIDTVSVSILIPPALWQQVTPPARYEFELVLPDGSVYPEKGHVVATPQDGTLRAWAIEFPNPRHVLQPGEDVKVRSEAP